MPRVTSRQQDGSPETDPLVEDSDDAALPEGKVTSAVVGLRGTGSAAARSAATRQHEEAALAEAAAECRHEQHVREAPSINPDFSDDSDPELLEEDGRGGLADASRRGPRACGAPAQLAALQHPLLWVSTTHGGRTRAEAALNLVVNLLGPGLLTMPRAIANVGVVAGVVLMALIAAANRYTLLLVLWMSENMLDETSYPEMGRHVFGQGGLLAVVLAYLLFTGGMLVAYLVLITDILAQLQGLSETPRAALVALAVVLCAPGAALSSLRHAVLVGAATAVSVLSLLASVLATCATQYESLTETREAEPEVGDAEHFGGDLQHLVAAVSLFALQFSVQAGGIELLAHISQPEPDELLASAEEAVVHDGHEASDLRAAGVVSKLAFALAYAACACLGLAGYSRFGADVRGNVLLSLQSAAQRPEAAIPRIAYMVVIVCSFAFMMAPFKVVVLDLLCRRRHSGDAMVHASRDKKVTVALMLPLAVTAWRAPGLEKVLEFVGAWTTMPLAFILPCAFMVELRRRTENMPLLCAGNALPLGLIACAGAVMAITGCSVVVEIMATFAAPLASGASGDRAMVSDLDGALVGANGSFPMSPSAADDPLLTGE